MFISINYREWETAPCLPAEAQGAGRKAQSQLPTVFSCLRGSSRAFAVNLSVTAIEKAAVCSSPKAFNICPKGTVSFSFSHFPSFWNDFYPFLKPHL
jgi:hypothetical protein